MTSRRACKYTCIKIAHMLKNMVCSVKKFF